MTPQKRKELLLHEANNPDSLYTHEGINSAYGIEFVLSYPRYEWKVYDYQKHKTDTAECENKRGAEIVVSLLS